MSGIFLNWQSDTILGAFELIVNLNTQIYVFKHREVDFKAMFLTQMLLYPREIFWWTFNLFSTNQKAENTHTHTHTFFV